MRRAHLVAGLAAVLAVSAAFAADDPSRVTARLESLPGDITVGDPVVLTLRATHPPGTVFDTPDVAAAFARAREPAGEEPDEAAVPLVMVDEIQPAAPGQGASAPGQTAWSIRLRLFKPGETTLPPIELTYRLPSSTDAHQVRTEPLVLRVNSVLKQPDEQAAANKGQWVSPRDWRAIALWGAAILLLAVLIFETIRRLRRRRSLPAAESPSAAPVPAVSPYERALGDLERLLASSLLAEGRIKEFHVILSEIVKRFLGDRHGFDALDRTTEEVLGDLSLREAGRDVTDPTRAFLHECDLVKFAKHRPDSDRIGQTVLAARHVIETGRPIRAEAAA